MDDRGQGSGDVEGLDVQQAAALVGMSTSWLYKAASRGAVPSFRAGASRRFRRAALEQWMAEREREEARRVRRERIAKAAARGHLQVIS